MIDILIETYRLYFKHGARSPKKVDCFHGKIKEILEKIISKSKDKNVLSVKLEYKVNSCNSSSKKRCDIVVFKNEKPYIIFPIKLIMTNYKQNKNNSWENLTGELCHIKWCNDEINIIPINILMNKTPYLNVKKIITKFENVTIQDIKIYNILKEKKLCYDIINYIIDVEHINKVGEKFSTIPTLTNFNKNTEYICFEQILKDLI